MRRKDTEKYAKYFAYMGIKDADALTDETLDQIREHGTISWVMENCGLSETEYVKRSDAWWNGLRIILHPELFKWELKQLIEDELPEKMAGYVRRRSKNPTEKITKAKIVATIQELNAENPQWWSIDAREELFFYKFSTMYPNCVDGQTTLIGKPQRTLTAPPSPHQVSTQKRVIEINALHVIIIVLLLFFLFFIIKLM